MNGKVGLGLVKKQQVVTQEELERLFPKKKGTITDLTLEVINETLVDPSFNGYSLMDTLIDYEDVMYKHKGNMIDYVNAIKFCAYLEGDSDSYIDAYKKVFRNREFVQERATADADSSGYKELSSAASRYRKSPMVQAILTRADVPLYLMFQGFRYKAVETLAKEMTTAAYSKDRIAAADKLLTHVKAPENMKMDINIGSTETTNIIDDYEKIIAKMVETQKTLIAEGGDLKTITNTSIKITTADVIDAELEDEK